MILFPRLDLLTRKLALNINVLSKIKKNVFSSSSEIKKRIENGPNLKHFLLSNIDAKDVETAESQEEIITNRLMDQVQNYSNEYLDQSKISTQKVYFEVHGCQMNVNDTEVAYSILKETGNYERTLDEKDADVVLVMTCSIRENAEQKIWNKLRQYRVLKIKRPDIRIGILGCMAERLKEKILDKEKLVDVICGPDSYRSLPSLLDTSLKTGNLAMNVQLSLEETYADISPIRINKNLKTAYLSIQRGCNNMCSFCIGNFKFTDK